MYVTIHSFFTDCPRAEVPHGFAVGPYGGKLYYTCHDGYKLATKGWWGEATCIGTVWSGLDLCIGNRHKMSYRPS